MKRAILLAAFLALPASAATLDAAVQGDDVVLTWDTGAPETILRGTRPDALTTFMTGVTSPLMLAGENALGRPNAYYRLASGSNMAFRLEVRIAPTGNPNPVTERHLALPERRAFRPRELFDTCPQLRQLTWWDPVDGRYEALARFGADIVGDDEQAPVHGGCRGVFDQPATVRMAGSEDATYSGVSAAEMISTLPQSVDFWTRDVGLLPNARRRTAFEILCGERNVDWFDVDGDGHPDECGRDLDGDGRPDTGLWHGPGAGERFALLLRHRDADGYARGITMALVLGRVTFSGVDFTMPPGEGFFMLGVTGTDLSVPADPTLVNAPFRPPAW